MNRLGIFGGTFDPIHNGHIKALITFIEAFDLNKAMVIPTAIPPHKYYSGDTDEVTRLEMTSLAVEGIERAVVSDFEIKNGGKSYTVETLRHFSKLYPDYTMFLFTGSDMFLTLQSWHKAEEIMSLAEIAAFSRTGEDYDKLTAQKDFLRMKYGAVCHILEFEPYCISSTMLRDIIKKGGDITAYVPKRVKDYIEINNLYKNNSEKSEEING